jgi:uncharacterized protein YraI
MFRNTTSRFYAAATAVALAMVLAACGAASPTPVPTRTPAPTFTPTPEIVPTPVDPAVAEAAREVELAPVQPAQPPADQPGDQPAEPPPPEPAPTDTPLPPPTPVPAAEVIVNTNMNVRGGPGTNYNIVGSASSGERYPIRGRDNGGAWWQIDFRGQDGWVFGDLVTAENAADVAIAQNIPAPPPPPPAPPAPPPVAEQPPQPEPAPPPQEEQAPPGNDSFPFILGETTQCAPNEGNTYFEGYVRDSNNNLLNAVCVHIAFYEPRGTKCSGCDGVGDGKWGFSPFGGPAPAGTPIEIFIVPCEGDMPMGGQTQATGFGNLTQQSPKWTRTINSSEQCTGITFYRR